MDIKTYLKLIVASIGLTFLVAVFSAISIIANLGSFGIALMQILSFLIAGSLLLIYMKKKDSTLKCFGFTKTTCSPLIYLILALIIFIQPIVLGFDQTIKPGFALLTCIQMIVVGFVEEVLFRGIFYYSLKNQKSIVFILFSSIVFGLLHFASGLNPQSAGVFVVLQVINALLLGAVFASLYNNYQSIYLVIFFHAGFNIMASMCPTASLQKEIIAVALLIPLYLILLFVLPFIDNTKNLAKEEKLK